MKDDKYLGRLYDSDYRFCQKVAAPPTSVEHRLGHFDAITEWQNTEEASAKFINTQAYQRFTQDDYILLIGRTGSGKTSILKKCQHEISNKKSKVFNFNHVISIYFKDYLVELIKHGEVNNTTESEACLEENIKMLLNLEVIRYIYSNTDFADQNFQSSKKIMRYLNDKKINTKIGLFAQAIDEVATIYKDKPTGNILNTISVLDRLRLKYVTNEYEEILEDIYKYLNDNRMLILIDTMDKYNVKEVEVILIIQKLIEVAFNEYYNKLTEHNILIKIALPAELAPLVIYRLPEKQQQNSVIIEWKYRELISMIAIRFFYYCKYKAQNNDLKQLVNGWSLNNFYDDYDLCKNFLLKILPEKCKASVSLSFDTLAYCIRHTQKKPRQLMKIFNILIDCIIRKGVHFFIDNPERISYYVHTTQSDIISDAVNMYISLTNTKILQIFTKTLYHKRFLIKKEDLINALKSTINKYDSDINASYKLEAEEYFEVLKESGFIGKIQSERYIEKNNNYFENENIIKIIVTLFEYQTKEKLIFSNSDLCVLHPMCFEYFENEVDFNSLVYPSPIYDEEDLGEVEFFLRDLLF